MAGALFVMTNKEEREMSLEENKALVRRYFEEYNKGNPAMIDELCTADFVWHAPGGLEQLSREVTKKVLTGFTTTFSDFRVTIEDMVAEGDKVVAFSKRTGTHIGEYRGIAATGKQVTWTWMVMFRIEGGKIAEEWDEGDHLSLMQQLGPITRPEQG